MRCQILTSVLWKIGPEFGATPGAVCHKGQPARYDAHGDRVASRRLPIDSEDQQRPARLLPRGMLAPARGNHLDLPARTKYIGQLAGALSADLDIWGKQITLWRKMRFKLGLICRLLGATALKQRRLSQRSARIARAHCARRAQQDYFSGKMPAPKPPGLGGSLRGTPALSAEPSLRKCGLDTLDCSATGVFGAAWRWLGPG